MNTIVLAGSEESRKQYIESFVQSHAFKSYNVRFYEDVKIADVRDCIKLLSQRLGVAEKRLIVFSGTITPDAQNALLKSLEELNDSTYIIFSVTKKEELLATILSRCSIVSGSIKSSAEVNNNYTALLMQLIQQSSIGSVLKFSENLNITSDAQYEELMLAVRMVLLESLGDTNRCQILLPFLEGLQQYYPLVTRNNVNKKFLIETLLLKELNAVLL